MSDPCHCLSTSRANCCQVMDWMGPWEREMGR